MFVLLLRRTNYRSIRRERYIYRYVLCKNFWLQVLCVYGTYPNLYIRQKQTTVQGPESKPVNQLGKFILVEICCNAAIFAMKYCMESVNITGKWYSILTGCATLNDRVVFASMLHVFIIKHEQEETKMFIDRGFPFVSKHYCIFLTEFPAS